jgi:four helix bundle protein
MNDGTTYDFEQRLLEFAARIVRFAEALPNSPAGKHVSNQVLRSGTAPMAHHGEAQAAESRNDFIHKMKIALKELRETVRWIKLAQRVPLVDKPELVDSLREENDELIRIFVASINTAEKKNE